MTELNEIIEVPVSHLLERADFMARSVEITSHTTKREQDGIMARQTGALGELVGQEHLSRCGVVFEPHFSTEFDVWVNVGDEKKKLEFKTKERTVRPRLDFECSVFDYLKDFQNVDYYLFISLLSSDSHSPDINRFSSAYILGSITKKEFDSKAVLWNPSDMDYSNGWRPKKPTWNVFVSELKAPMPQKEFA